MLTPKDFWTKAAQWGSYISSGDPGACLYGFDERGLVQSEEHRQACIAYIEDSCRKAADTNIACGDDPDTQHPELDSLLEYLRACPSVETAVTLADLDGFTRAYIYAMLWSSTDDDGDPIDAYFSPAHLSNETLEEAKNDCAWFLEHYGHLITDANLARRRSDASVEEMAGHDFWLTRAGHGAGFWDGDWADPAGDILTEASKSFGEMDVYIGDDGRIHTLGGISRPRPVEAAARAPQV